MNKKLSLIFFSMLMLIALPRDALPVEETDRQDICFDYQILREQLQEAYKEAPVSMGLQGNGELMQIFLSSDRGTWTVLSVSPDGLGCVLATGDSWQSTATAYPDTGS